MRENRTRWKRAVLRYGARWALGLSLSLAAVLHAIGFYSSDSIERMDGFLSGLRMRIEKPVLDRRVVIVDIDEKSLSLVGRWPWSRDVQATLVRQLTGFYAVGAVGFDVSFPEADTSSGYGVLQKLADGPLKDVALFREQLAALKGEMDYDGLFADALRGQPVVLGYNVSDNMKKGLLPAPAFTVERLNGRELLAREPSGYEANIARLQSAAAGAGVFTAAPDADGVIRSSVLLYKIGDGYYPTLSLATAAVYLKARAIFPVFESSVDEMSANERAAGGVDYVTLFLPKRNISIPVGYGMEAFVQFRGRGGANGGAFRYVSAVDVLTGSVAPEVLRGALVLVGTTAPGLNDMRVTPVNATYPGVEVHANMIKSILDNDFKARPDTGWVIEAIELLAFGTVLGFALAVLSPLRSIALAVAALAGAVAINLYLYYQLNAVINAAAILLLIVALFVLNVAYGYFFEVRKSQALVSRFSQYVAPELVAEMADDPEQYTMEGESRELTVLFVDVRGFTTISEGLEPRELREYINLYLTAMSVDIRDSHQGTLDKYIGDAVMAFWGAPVAFADHASRAVATSLLMQASAARLNAQFSARGWPPLKIGIGINTGIMHVGDMGSQIRQAYTVMGDAVNLGSRLEGITKVYGVGIAVGETTRAAACHFLYRELDRVRVKGKNVPVAIYEPLGLVEAASAALAAELAAWDAALVLVRGRQWNAAQAAVISLAEAHPGCALYQLYLARLAQWQIDPPAPHWDGATSFDTK
ncbi:CHASE2 domain-containing protein [Massilia sp. TSP1-1-2]|uniref:CHASE2 domain-containing protein n=1 Tax=Massilia sp. TSP1-1-2 TaxID=2804649 RepID=UPI003CF612D8